MFVLFDSTKLGKCMMFCICPVIYKMFTGVKTGKPGFCENPSLKSLWSALFFGTKLKKGSALPKTNIAPENGSLPTTNFQGRALSFSEGRCGKVVKELGAQDLHMSYVFDSKA